MGVWASVLGFIWTPRISKIVAKNFENSLKGHLLHTFGFR